MCIVRRGLRQIFSTSGTPETAGSCRNWFTNSRKRQRPWSEHQPGRGGRVVTRVCVAHCMPVGLCWVSPSDEVSMYVYTDVHNNPLHMRRWSRGEGGEGGGGAPPRLGRGKCASRTAVQFSRQSPTCLDALRFPCQGLASQLTTNSGTTRLELAGKDITAEDCKARCPQGTLQPKTGMLAVDDRPHIHQNRVLMSFWLESRREALADVPNAL